jgi:perosamine synthetase
MIPYGKHYIDEADIKAVTDVLKGSHLTQGPLVEAFESAISNYVGCKYAVAVSSGTAALHLAYMAAGVLPGNAIVTSPITFVATANAARYCGGDVIFSDIDLDNINISPAALQETLSKNLNVKVVAPVHFAGLPCDMLSIKKIADKSGAIVIEDAAHALGATYPNGKHVGCCENSLMTIFSFHPVKAIAAGEGGMITTNDYNIYRKLLRLRSHGINKLDDPFLLPDQAQTGGTLDPWYYEMQELGFHYRITDIQCALALSQLKKLDSFIAKRRELVKIYDQAFHGDVNVFPAQISGRRISAHHLYVLRINYDAIGLARNKLMSNLKTHGIVSQVHYIPVPAQPYYRNLGFNPEDYPNAQRYYQEALSIPLFFDLTNEQQQQVISRINALIR